MFNRPNWQVSIRFHVTFCQVLGLYCILTKVCLPDFHLNSYRWELIAAIYGLSSAWVDSEIRDPPDVWTWRCLLFTFADSKQTEKKSMKESSDRSTSLSWIIPFSETRNSTKLLLRCEATVTAFASDECPWWWISWVESQGGMDSQL